MIVHKFGGTSIPDSAGFLAVAEIIQSQLTSEGKDRALPGAVVLSAISGVNAALVQGGRDAASGNDHAFREITQNLFQKHLAIIEGLPIPKNQQRVLTGIIDDELHSLDRIYRSIAILGEFTRRGRDTVAAFGPVLSVQILAAFLQKQGIPARPINTSDILILETASGEAVPLMAPTQERAENQLLPMIKEGLLPVCTASIGSTTSGTPAVLNRGGGDTSAAALAAALGADECWIWTDVDGILTADPAFTSEAQPLQEISYTQAAELARFGSDVIHPATLIPGLKYGFPIRIRNSYAPSVPGTMISNNPSPKPHPPAILSMTDLCLLSIQADEESWSLQSAASILETLHNTGVEVLMFSQPMSSPGLLLILRNRDSDYAIKSLLNQQLDPVQLSFETTLKTAMITVVTANGRPSGQDVSSKTLKLLGELEIAVHAIARSGPGNSFSFCVPEVNCLQLVASLHSLLIAE